MSKLTNLKLRRMIMQELANIVDEDALVSIDKDKHIRGDVGLNYPIGEKSTCSECGGMTYEGECMECGYTSGQMLEEGGCGCGTCVDCDDGTDYSIDTMYDFELAQLLYKNTSI